jgi:IS605 OrfB family transposase
LTANYVVRAIARVCSTFGRGKEPPKQFKPTSLDLDVRLMAYHPHDELVSISTIRGRRKIRLKVGQYQRQQLQGQKPKAATLNFDERTNKFYINLVIEIEAPDPGGDSPLGVDRGIKRIASTSEGKHYSGRKLNRTRERYARTRASLQTTKAQRPGTNVYRVLKRLSRRERRFQKDTNHIISKQIVQRAKETNAYIVLEKLERIRERTAHKGKDHRRRMGRWAFFQLETFIQYKAEAAGVPVVFVNPAYTSQRCPACGSLGSRRKHKFVCKSCGYAGDADTVGALNIAALGAQVNRPAKSSSSNDKPLALAMG